MDGRFGFGSDLNGRKGQSCGRRGGLEIAEKQEGAFLCIVQHDSKPKYFERGWKQEHLKQNSPQGLLLMIIAVAGTKILQPVRTPVKLGLQSKASVP